MDDVEVASDVLIYHLLRNTISGRNFFCTFRTVLSSTWALAPFQVVLLLILLKWIELCMDEIISGVAAD